VTHITGTYGPKGEACRTCYFWERMRENDFVGECHRFPPTPFLTAKGLGTAKDILSTTTFKSRWCGEYKALAGADKK